MQVEIQRKLHAVKCSPFVDVYIVGNRGRGRERGPHKGRPAAASAAGAADCDARRLHARVGGGHNGAPAEICRQHGLPEQCSCLGSCARQNGEEHSTAALKGKCGLCL